MKARKMTVHCNPIRMKHWMKTSLLFAVILVGFSLAGIKVSGQSLPPSEKEMCWWYDTPATKYWEGLPIATGRFAAMVSGKTGEEQIVLNEETLWSGGP